MIPSKVSVPALVGSSDPAVEVLPFQHASKLAIREQDIKAAGRHGKTVLIQLHFAPPGSIPVGRRPVESLHRCAMSRRQWRHQCPSSCLPSTSPYAEPSADPRQAERQGRVGQRVYSPKTIAEFVRLGTGRSAARSSSARRSRSLARQATSARSPGRKRSWPAKLAADHAADRLIALSLPPRRPIAHHSSRTLRLGGSRSATSRKKASSCGVIRSAKPNAPFSIALQPFQLSPSNQRPNSSGSSMAVAMSTVMPAAAGFGFLRRRARAQSSGRGITPPPCRDGPTCSHRGATAKVSRAQLCWECPRGPVPTGP